MTYHRKVRRARRRTSRDRRLIAAFASVLLASGGALGVHLAAAEPPPVLTIEQPVTVGPDGRLSIQFVGDTMLGADAQEGINLYGYDWPFSLVAPLLDGDHVIANLESSLTLHAQPQHPGKPYNYASDPASAGAIARAGVDSIGLANNHAMDMGPPGLTDTLAAGAAAGLTAFGAGANVASAERPLMLRSPAGTVGVVALGESFGASTVASETQPGMVPFSTRAVQRGVDLARAAGADWVVAYVHWGDNYAAVNQQQRYWAKILAAAGYDLVIGHGPHITQPIEYIGSVPVVYSVGNFVFGSDGQYGDFGVPGIGLSVSLTLGQGEPATLTVRCLATDNEVVNFQPRACAPQDAATLLPALTPQFQMVGDVGVLPARGPGRAP
jgi:hypothetical protein